MEQITSLTHPQSRSKWFRLLLIVAIAATAIYFGKLAYEAIHTTHDLVEEVKTKAEAKAKAETHTKTHGNSHNNMQQHIVYEIYGLDAWGVKFVLKYGISSRKNYQTKWGNPRPNLQLKNIATRPECSRFDRIDYAILDSMIEGRLAAKSIEQQYINQYVVLMKDMPPLQKLPLPEDDLF